jgi:hypothetical protein
MYPASVERSMSLPETLPREAAASSLEIAGWLTLKASASSAWVSPRSRRSSYSGIHKY